VYPREAVIAEKFQAMVVLGIANSRMKDFYDIWVLAKRFAFEGELLAESIKQTFGRRGTPLAAQVPLALTDEFAQDHLKQSQWEAFLRRGQVPDRDIPLADVISGIRDLVMPPTLSLARGKAFELHWPPGGPWK